MKRARSRYDRANTASRYEGSAPQRRKFCDAVLLQMTANTQGAEAYAATLLAVRRDVS
jgi:hypothetical protein